MELSLFDMVEKLAAAEIAIHHNAHEALERVAQRVEVTAKSELGIYQPETGPFPAWAELADSTQSERERLGYAPNDPLLRDGTLRDSLDHEVSNLEAVIGSESEIAAYQEFGTSRIPPRPFLGPAVEHNHGAIIKELGGAVVAALVGQKLVHSSLGYDRTVTSE